MKYFISGFLIAFFFDNVSDIMFYISKLIRAILSLQIAKCEAKINEISNEFNKEESEIRHIGFDILDENREQEESR